MFDPRAAVGAIALLAATVNGALGYGFSSITVPLALLFLTNRVLNPALVLVEVPLNAHVLFVNRAEIPAVWRRALPLIIGLVPGITVGALIVSRIAPAWVRLLTFAVLLPVVFAQLAGRTRRVRAERRAALLFGGGLGVLYSVTTISGPPLAVALSNQGLSGRQFRAALGLVRLTESTITAAVYLATGLVTMQSLSLIPFVLPGVALGIPAGSWLMRRVPADAFRRACMGFDALIVGFGLSVVVRELGLLPAPAAFGLFAVIAAVDALILWRFVARPAAARSLVWRGPSGPRSDARVA